MAETDKGPIGRARRIEVGDLEIGQDLPFVLIAGPCQIESRDHALEMAEALSDICGEREIGLIYKSSFDKANRTSAGSARGVGLAKGIEILADVKEQFGCPVITDVHESAQCADVAEVVDVLQIPAFLCRQTDLLKAAAETSAAVHVKKGQFLAPWDMVHVVRKLEQFGADRILLGERGTSFGYNTLVSDFRGLPEMAATGWPLVFDSTHSVQQPGGQGGASGGQREFVPVLARAALAIGVAALFIETHQDPDNAPSDGPNMVPIDRLSRMLSIFQDFDRLAKSHPLNLTL
ncbi:MAG: 3-deoxy-8-phosphooctulonate synthase [Alphaproteobacteria bacterium]|nr:3-deoxy-8-phosphooctulonate synthase [Alphaproteobacteria bacterium]